MLETIPMLVDFSSKDKDLNIVSCAAGDSVSLAVGKDGEVRAWGSFRVSLLFRSRNGRC